MSGTTIVNRISTTNPKILSTERSSISMIRKKSLTWTQKLSDQLNLAHVARKKYEKEETKTDKRQCPLSSIQLQDP